MKITLGLIITITSTIISVSAIVIVIVASITIVVSVAVRDGCNVPASALVGVEVAEHAAALVDRRAPIVAVERSPARPPVVGALVVGGPGCLLGMVQLGLGGMQELACGGDGKSGLQL